MSEGSKPSRPILIDVTSVTNSPSKQLILFGLNATQLNELVQVFERGLVREYRENLSPYLTPCMIPSQQDGRISCHQRKFYAYHIAAYKKFSRELMQQVSVDKSDSKPLTVSHICGSERSLCVNPSHLVVELKSTNDTRTHCHYFLNGHSGTEYESRVVKEFIDNFCNHNPKCCKDTA